MSLKESEKNHFHFILNFIEYMISSIWLLQGKKYKVIEDLETTFVLINSEVVHSAEQIFYSTIEDTERIVSFNI